MPAEQRIKESLMALMDGIKRADAEVISREMAALDRCLEGARGGIHPQLAHYLQNRSYPKALAFLGGDSAIPEGTCGRGGP